MLGRIKFTKLYNILKNTDFILAMLVVATPLISVFTKAMVSQTSIELEQVKEKIENQTGINESLNMKINELASLDKLQEVANEHGLSYNNDNIKVITDTES